MDKIMDALEFLTRSAAVQDHVIKNLLQVLPLSSATAVDTRFKKAVLLRTIQSEVSNATVIETTLQVLELIEEMDRNDGVEIGELLKAAYFAATVECTVKYLALEGINGKYFEAVKRVWRGRIGNLEKSGNRSELVRDNAELTRWKNDLEAALWDAKVAKRLMNLNTRAEALQKLRAFLGEAWALMGSSFIEAAAATSNGAGELAAEQEVAAWVPELAANEEDKLVAGKAWLYYTSDGG
ncbi:uncharacterized protein LOC115978014 isoform X2 [Quercus lobata]|uniref:Uncharacterized protein n=1 Tax=Quercus lobata TaxID=97700 RepID=A0A7N2LVC0_QUELO|nr:uncharacterized protein LOC115950582 isoform X2 [Quercus lobata]XP_030955909.1 uncharacterized protein LOC115978014 isoform X2 [Quercus lobata]